MLHYDAIFSRHNHMTFFSHRILPHSVHSIQCARLMSRYSIILSSLSSQQHLSPPVAPAFLQHSLEFVNLLSGFRRQGTASCSTKPDFAKRERGPMNLPLLLPTVRADVSKDHRSPESCHSSSPQEERPGSRARLPRAGRDFCMPLFAVT